MELILGLCYYLTFFKILEMVKLVLQMVYFPGMVLLNDCQVIKFKVICVHLNLQVEKFILCPGHHLESECLCHNQHDP